MKALLVGLGTSILASALTYLVFTLTEDLTPALRWTVVGGTGGVGLLIAWRAARNSTHNHQDDVSVGDRLSGKGDVSVEDISVKGDAGGTKRIATRIRAGRNTKVKGVRVDSSDSQ